MFQIPSACLLERSQVILLRLPNTLAAHACIGISGERSAPVNESAEQHLLMAELQLGGTVALQSTNSQAGGGDTNGLSTSSEPLGYRCSHYFTTLEGSL